VRLDTERLLLRDLEEADAPAANRYESDPIVVRYTTRDVSTVAESLAYIRNVRAESAQVPRRLYDLAVCERDGERYVGRAGLSVRDPEQREGMLWYVIDRSRWGRGYAVEAALALLGLAFDALGLHRVAVDIDPRNHASLRVAEKLGMRREGHFVENFYCKGEWTDSVILALLEREWRAAGRGPGRRAPRPPHTPGLPEGGSR
jgi:RimJ/RimL family protein N-acetyltransferase